MTRRRVILLVFAGRTPNMALQVPMVKRILARHPTAEYHIANMARNKTDAMHLRLISGDRITVRNDFYRYRFPYVYADYAGPAYKDCLFVKLDDDIVFLETERFGALLDAIEANPGAVVSATTINNGASTRTIPALWQQFEDLGIDLLDVHKSNAYADLAHQYFRDHHGELLNAPIAVTPTKDWLSINCVGFDWNTMRSISAKLDKPSPPNIAGRTFNHHDRIGDEGAANLLPRFIVSGFTAAHLGYGPQHLTGAQADCWRDAYRTIGQGYLTCPPPAASPASAGADTSSTSSAPPVKPPKASPATSRQGTPAATPT